MEENIQQEILTEDSFDTECEEQRMSDQLARSPRDYDKVEKAERLLAETERFLNSYQQTDSIEKHVMMLEEVDNYLFLLKEVAGEIQNTYWYISGPDEAKAVKPYGPKLEQAISEVEDFREKIIESDKAYIYEMIEKAYGQMEKIRSFINASSDEKEKDAYTYYQKLDNYERTCTGLSNALKHAKTFADHYGLTRLSEGLGELIETYDHFTEMLKQMQQQ